MLLFKMMQYLCGDLEWSHRFSFSHFYQQSFHNIDPVVINAQSVFFGHIYSLNFNVDHFPLLWCFSATKATRKKFATATLALLQVFCLLVHFFTCLSVFVPVL